MKTETQEFKSLQEYEGSIEADKVIGRLIDTIGNGIDDVYDDMCKELGNETTDDAVEDYLADTSHIEEIIGWGCIRYESPEEEEEEERIAWAEICDWDDR